MTFSLTHNHSITHPRILSDSLAIFTSSLTPLIHSYTPSLSPRTYSLFQIVDSFIMLLSNMAPRGSSIFFPTQFYANLAGHGDVQRWTHNPRRNIDIFQKTKVRADDIEKKTLYKLVFPIYTDLCPSVF